MTKPILVTRDFGCCTTMCNQTMVTKKDFLSVFYDNIWFSILKNQENWRMFWVLNVNSTKFSIFWLNFAKNLTPKKWKFIKRPPFVSKTLIQMNNYWFNLIIWCLWPFIIAFLSWYGHKDLPMCQNIGKK
jgi:hypothetical protein